jgi:hypothetical protein
MMVTAGGWGDAVSMAPEDHLTTDEISYRRLDMPNDCEGWGYHQPFKTMFLTRTLHHLS